MNLDFSNIGKRLQKTRIQRDISPQQMANAINISTNKIKQLENGKANIELNDFMKICDFLNISIYDVLNEKYDNIIEYMDKDLYNLIIQCNVKKQKFIYNMVKLLMKNQVVWLEALYKQNGFIYLYYMYGTKQICLDNNSDY